MTDDQAAAGMTAAAARTVSRIGASEAALERYAELRRRNALGAGMTLDARERVRQRSESLARQADPIGSRGPRKERPTNGPTPERYAHLETAIETYTTTVRAGRDVASEAWRVVPIVEHMRRRGQLGELEERAAERFYRDFVLGHRVAGLVASYGDRVSGGYEGGGDMRTHFHGRFVSACRAVGHWPTIEWMVRIICEQLMAAETTVPTLADAGRAYLGYRNQQQAQAVGATLIKTGLERLVAHYGLDPDGRRDTGGHNGR